MIPLALKFVSGILATERGIWTKQNRQIQGPAGDDLRRPELLAGRNAAVVGRRRSRRCRRGLLTGRGRCLLSRRRSGGLARR